MGARRRPRPLQDDRRRQDLEPGAQDFREYRRQRRRARSAQSRTSSSPRRTNAAVVSPPSSTADPRARSIAAPTAARPGRRSPTGLPDEQLGRIGLAISPVQPDILYANVEAANRKGGIFRSTDNGVTWEKRTEYNAGAMYYGDIYADPKNVDRIYIPDVIFQVSDDGGKTMHSLGQRNMHVDNHVIWVDPVEYEPHDGRQRRRALPFVRWRRDLDVFREPAARSVLRRGRGQRGAVLQRLRRAAGQQFARWTVAHPIAARHPEPGLVRHAGRRRFRLAGRSRGSQHDLRRVAARRPRALRQAHRRTRRHSAAGREGRAARALELGLAVHHLPAFAHAPVLRRADALPIGRPRQQLEDGVAGSDASDRSQHAGDDGPVWGPDAVAKNTSTALYGNISAIAESPRKEGLIYVGTDDGLVQVSENAGAQLAQGRSRLPACRPTATSHASGRRSTTRRRSMSWSRTIRTATSRRIC